MTHVGLDDAEAELLDHLPNLPRAGFVGSGLRRQIRDVVVDGPARVRAGSEQSPGFLFEEGALVDHLEIVDEHAFLLDPCAVRRRGPRSPSSDVRVVPARTDKEEDFLA